ncbi:hypothetical protein [Pseudopelagicola sp. nBUS_19]|uniref:hypothetical protein n=1 Tax=Pseudopelagicola sp. nBUS_19 TaxID=3395316 RepID=UPI003EBC4AB2
MSHAIKTLGDIDPMSWAESPDELFADDIRNHYRRKIIITENTAMSIAGFFCVGGPK